MSLEVTVAGRQLLSTGLIDIGIVVVTSGNGRKSRVFMYKLS
jgi:hypothetical protein